MCQLIDMHLCYRINEFDGEKKKEKSEHRSYNQLFFFVIFFIQTYPDEDHSLWGVRRHLYHALDKFFAKCLTNTTNI